MMLGSNDLKETFHASPEQIAEGAGVLVETIQNFTREKQGFEPKIVLVCPTEIGEGITESPFYGSFYENAIERSRQLPALYKSVAERFGCIFVNAAAYIRPSAEDSLHLDPQAHAKLAEVLAEAVIQIR